MNVLPKFVSWKKKLEERGFKVLTPRLVDHRMTRSGRRHILTIKRAENRRHFEKIRRSDAILVLNYSIGKSQNYIGGSTFAEIAIAFYLGKRIFLVNPIPRSAVFREELEAWRVRKWHAFK
jgi:hypothetical protein